MGRYWSTAISSTRATTAPPLALARDLVGFARGKRARRRRVSRHDVVVVGAGPCGSRRAPTGWPTPGGAWRSWRRRTFPRAKTCGDGLTPRAVLQLRDDGPRGRGRRARAPLRGPARPRLRREPGDGLARAPGLPGLRLHDHAARPRRPGRGRRARRRGRPADRPRGRRRRSTSPPRPGRSPARPGSWCATTTRRRPSCAGATWWSPTGRTRASAASSARRATATGRWGWRCAATTRRRATAEPWIDSHLDIRDPDGQVVPGYGWLFPLGDGRVNVGVGLLSTEGAGKGVNTTKLQEYFVAQVADAWGLSAEPLAAPTGGRLLMGLSIGPRVGANTLLVGDAAGAINPFNGEGIAYGYETGRLAAAALGEALAGERPRRARALRRAPGRGLRRLLPRRARLRARDQRAARADRLRRGRHARRAGDVVDAQGHGQPHVGPARGRRARLPGRAEARRGDGPRGLAELHLSVAWTR